MQAFSFLAWLPMPLRRSLPLAALAPSWTHAATLCTLLMTSYAFADWWEQPHDTCYLKDDWKAAEVAGYSPHFRLESPAANGWIVIWGDQGVQLSVNGTRVMKHVDRGLIYDSDLTPFVQGADEVTLQCGPGKIVAEGELVDDQGRRYPFASGCDWPVPAPADARLPPAAKPYRPGESSGAFHSAHNGHLIRYNDEERGKADIAKTLARSQKLREQSIFLLRRLRPVEEILTFSPDTLWRRAESQANGPMAEAETLLREHAVPAQKSREFRGAIGFAAKANGLLAEAELAVDTARGVEEASRQLLHLEACARLVTDAGTNTPALNPTFEVARQELALARQDAVADNWRKTAERCAAVRKILGTAAERLSQAWGAPVGALDEFPEDRFGWLNAQARMGNDPAQWEFSMINPAFNWIDLRGVWRFRTDPPDQGEALGWHKPGGSLAGWRLIKVPGQWERAGVRDDNEYAPWDCPYKLNDRRCDDKPYNGYAWYRRDVVVPKSWEGHNISLRIGQVSNWLRVFLNGKAVGEPRCDGGTFTLTADLVKAGELNALAIQVYNHDNFGGITGGPVSLSLDDFQPHSLTTPGPMSFTTETTFDAGTKRDQFVAFAPAMSPAVVVASDQTSIRLWGWDAKGFAPPKTITFLVGATPKEVPLDKPGAVVSGTDLSDSWLYLHSGTNRNDSVLTNSRPVFLVLERRPQQISWGTNSLGFSELTLSFTESGGRVIIFALNLGEARWTVDDAGIRAKTLRAVPVA